MFWRGMSLSSGHRESSIFHILQSLLTLKRYLCFSADTDPHKRRCRWDGCRKSHFLTGSQISRHLREVHGVEAPRDSKQHISCQWRGCKRKLTHRNMAKHIRIVHLGLSRHICLGCGTLFTTLASVTYHQKKFECGRISGFEPRPTSREELEGTLDASRVL